MRRRQHRDLAVGVAVILAVLAGHVLVTFEVIRISGRRLGWIAVVLLVAVVAGLHVVGFRRLAARRGRRGTTP